MVRTCVDSALEDLEWLQDNPGLSTTMEEQIQILKIELRFIRVFLLYMKNRRDVVSKDDSFQSLLTSIEASMSSATKNLYGDGLLVMYNRRKTRGWGQNLFEKINHLKQEIRRACDVWCESSLSTIDDDDVKAALEFLDPLLQNLDSLVNLKPDMTLSVKNQFETLKRNLQFLRDLVSFTSKQSNENAEREKLLTLLGAVSCNAACLSYICWVDQSIGGGTNAMLSDLLQKLKPNTSDGIEMYLGLLKVPYPAGLDVAFKQKVVESAVDFLLENLVVVHVECEFEILRDQLVLLLMYLMDPLSEETRYREKMLILTKAAVNEAQSLLIHSCKIDLTAKEMQYEVSLLLSKLHEKVKFVVVEVFLVELLNHNSDWMVLIKDYTNALHEGCKFLIGFLMDPPEKYTDDSELMHVYMEEVVKEVGSLIDDTVDADEMTESLVMEMNLRLVKLFDNLKLIKQVELLIKLLNQKGSRFVLEMDLEMELNFIKAFLVGLPKEEKLMLKQIGAVVNDTISILNSMSNKEMKENTAIEVNLLLSHLLEQIKSVKAKVSKAYLQLQASGWSSMSNFPSTDGAGFVEFFIEHLREILSEKADLISQIKNYVKIILRELEFLRPFLGHNEQEELQDFRGRVTDSAYQADNAIDLYLVKGAASWYCILWLSHIIEDIMIIKKDAPKICKNTSFSNVINVQNTWNREFSSEYNITTHGLVVGLKSKVEDIKNRLLGGDRELEIIPIVGTAGLGKTTLARNVYEDPSIINQFRIRAWCYVSQVYDLRDLVAEILTQVIKSTDEIDNAMTAEDLGQLLYRSLRGRKYFIVLDDIWDVEAWRGLRPSFPEDRNSSRIIFTSRLHKLASQAGVKCDLYSLHPFSEEECSELLQKMLFHKDGWPDELSIIGKEIARRCDGLPLLVAVIAGVLAQTDRTEDKWKAIEENFKKSTVPGDPKHFMNKLDMSYMNLPDHLKACFLYLGAFAFEREIPVWKLIRLWIAEGLVRKPKDGSIEEDTAESYLKDLIDRSLVKVAKKRSNGRVKACNIHNLIRDLCLRRVAEENFLQPITGRNENLSSSPKHYEHHRRLCIYSKREDLVSSIRPFSPSRVRSLLFFASGDVFRLLDHYDISLIFHSFKILRVLDLSSINVGNSFPEGLALLTHLRYLAIRGSIRALPPSIVNLQNLETLLVKGLRGEIEVPDTFWKMTRLRHVQILGRVLIKVDFEYGRDKFPILSNLDTLTTPSFYYSSWYEVMSTLRRLPALRKLRCVLLESWHNGGFPELDLLSKLEALKVLNHGYLSYPCHFHLPNSLKKLTLSKFRLPWDAITEIGRLPNLEVLKLINQAFRGHKWDTKSGEFQKLKYLKLKSLDIVEWDADIEQFPCLEQLVLERCEHLEEIPLCFKEIPTLQFLQVQWCNSSAANSARDIEEEQQGNGNEALKVLIYPQDFQHS